MLEGWVFARVPAAARAGCVVARGVRHAIVTQPPPDTHDLVSARSLGDLTPAWRELGRPGARAAANVARRAWLRRALRRWCVATGTVRRPDKPNVHLTPL